MLIEKHVVLLIVPGLLQYFKRRPQENVCERLPLLDSPEFLLMTIFSLKIAALQNQSF